MFLLGRFLVEIQVPVAPVDAPLAGRLRVAQPSDREADRVALGGQVGADLHDIDVAVGNVGFDLELGPDVLGNPCTRPEVDAV